MSIYTKTGDGGATSLANGERVSKTDVRIEAYGTVDELNSHMGGLRASVKDSLPEGPGSAVDNQLKRVQVKLFDLGAALSCADARYASGGSWICEEDTKELEDWIDGMQAELPKQHSFVLPSGSEAVCRCHICRTVCRRAERRIAESCTYPEGQKWVNRLSDYLFVLARYIGYLMGEKEEIWENK